MMRKLLVLLIALISQLAFAHDLDLTLIKLDHLPGRTIIVVSTPLSRLVRIANLGSQPSMPELDLEVRRRLEVPLGTHSDLKVDAKSDMLTWSGVLTDARGTITARFDESTTSAQTLVATYENGQYRSEAIIGSAKPKTTNSGLAFTGVQHILSGPDHILFVVGLALLGGGWLRVIKVVTAFTLAHSITLALASLNLVSVSPRLVEPLIALSIVALAVEGLRRREPSGGDWPRVLIAFGFGLIHGLGFAGGLSDLGLQGPSLVQSLVSFNVGIEFGQLLILTPSLFLLAGLAKIGADRRDRFAFAASICLGMTGCFWFAERLF